jgi:hypothetical protein
VHVVSCQPQELCNVASLGVAIVSEGQQLGEFGS